MITINMMSKADRVQGQGVLSAHDEQVRLVREELSDRFQVVENSRARCDITHYHTINPEFVPGLLRARRRGTAVGYVHFLPETLETSIRLPHLAKRAFYWYVIRFYKSMNYLVTVNPYFIDRLAAYGIDRKKVCYIPNFVSAEQFYPIEDRDALRARWGLEPGRFTVLCAGQLQKLKGVLDFLEIARQMPKAQFLWAGDFSFGRISDGYEQIRQAAAAPPENVRFLGLVERDRMNELYNLADVMFLPSYEELFPMTILEAMNCGVPILLRDLPIYREILSAYSLCARDNAGLLNQLRRLSADAGYHRAASERSWAGHVFYSREHVAGMWRYFYEGVAVGETELDPQTVELPRLARKA